VATHWYVDTDASDHHIESAFRTVFLTRPSFFERFKFYDPSAQLRSNIAWKAAHVAGADHAACIVSGGLREMASNTRSGPGSVVGTTIALKIHDEDSSRAAQLWLANHPTFIGLNTVGDLLRRFSKMLARELQRQGHSARAHK
jgi:hypothetical protein